MASSVAFILFILSTLGFMPVLGRSIAPSARNEAALEQTVSRKYSDVPSPLSLQHVFYTNSRKNFSWDDHELRRRLLVRGVPTQRANLAITKFTFELPVDTSLPASPGCFETCANEYQAGQLSYQQFLDAALTHLNPTLPTRHPEDRSLANLAKLSTCGSMGPVAAAIKLCMLSDSGQPIFSQDTIDHLHAMQLSADSFDDRLPTTPAALPSLHLQVVILAALCREMPTLAAEVLSANPPPAPPEQSLFNLLNSAVCPVGSFSRSVFSKFPVDFWTAAVKAGWVAPSPRLAYVAAGVGPHAARLLRALLDTGLDVTLVLDDRFLYDRLLDPVAEKQDDPSLLRDIIARVPRKKLESDLLRLVVSQREVGGVEMLAMLLDHGLNINYRNKKRVSLSVQHDPWAGDYWYQESLTALYMAAKKGNKDAVSFLLSRGGKVNEPSFTGILQET
ncbi:hypothetical protein NUW58_g4774 [Xylaria curta]|uniref:Uncharacterized protein n=1 Tax=Xylaria curta TaxID=42375 RepID=A0ACC1P6H0_9PEZI|nr:hypothetical protein NUW58_g4774 [Xylaria curta]